MNTPLNQDALAHARSATFDCWESGGNMDDLAECAIEAYLAAALPEAKAVAWEEGFQAGWEEHEDPGAFVNDFWDAKTPNPYLQKGN